jgi:hypothetical protein
VVGLVGEAAREVARAFDHKRVAVLVEPAHHGPVRTRYVHHRTRHRQAALALVEQPAPGRVERVEDRIDDVSDMPDTVVVGAVVHEQAQIDAHLVGREAGSVGDVHGEEHVVDERGEVGPELGDVPARPVQDLFTDLGDASHGTASGLGCGPGIGVDGAALDEDTWHELLSSGLASGRLVSRT